MTASQVGRHTNLVVGGLMGLSLVGMAFHLAMLQWGFWYGLFVGLGLTGALIYEGWTLVNDFPEDTISESMWRLATRPLVPWLFGGLSVWMVESNTLTNPYLVGAWFFLQAHFFFQAQQTEREHVVHAVIEAAETGEAKLDGVIPESEQRQ